MSTEQDRKKALLRKMLGEQLPEGTFAISPEDKPLIRELGRELSAFVLGFAQTKGGLNVKILHGAVDYMINIIGQRKKLIADHFGDELLLAIETVQKEELSSLIDEPFTDEPVAPQGAQLGAAVAPAQPVAAATPAGDEAKQA